MSALDDLLRELEQAGVTLALLPDGRHIEISYRVDPPEELVLAIKKAKSTLILWLRSQMAGHCGTCRRFTRREDFGSWMGQCSAGRRRHGWLDGNPEAPVEIHMAHRCAVGGGKGYQRRPLDSDRQARQEVDQG